MNEILTALNIEERNLGGFCGEWMGSGPELTVPAPRRGELVYQIWGRLREVKGEVGALVTLEMGEIRAEGEGEVQGMIDICDFGTGLSRQLYGLTIASERQDPPHDGAVAPLGGRGGDQRVQFLSSCLELERGSGVCMRRQTNTVNRSTELPLAQGIEFGS
jgi:hypothetical protein